MAALGVERARPRQALVAPPGGATGADEILPEGMPVARHLVARFGGRRALRGGGDSPALRVRSTTACRGAGHVSVPLASRVPPATLGSRVPPASMPFGRTSCCFGSATWDLLRAGPTPTRPPEGRAGKAGSMGERDGRGAALPGPTEEASQDGGLAQSPPPLGPGADSDAVAALSGFALLVCMSCPPGSASAFPSST